MKYIKALLRRVFSLLKLSIIKIIHFKKFRFAILQIISLSTRFEFLGSGKILLGKNIGTRRNVEFRVASNGVIKIGEGCFFNNNCMVVSHERIKIGNNCSFGPNVLIFDHDHDYSVEGGIKSQKFKTSPIEIGNNVWVGANSVILRGTKIGDNTVIGAGEVIKGEYPSNSIVVSDRKKNIVKYNVNNTLDLE